MSTTLLLLPSRYAILGVILFFCCFFFFLLLGLIFMAFVCRLSGYPACSVASVKQISFVMYI